MADIIAKLTNYGIGMILGLVAYHYVLRAEIPSLPALNNMNEMGGVSRTGCSNCGQR